MLSLYDGVNEVVEMEFDVACGRLFGGETAGS